MFSTAIDLPTPPTPHMNLRRIEMFTIRRFLETGRQLPNDILNPGDTIAKVVEDAKNHQLSDEYVKGVETEASFILKSIPIKDAD